MSEALSLPKTGSRTEVYEALIPQIASLISDEPDLTANLANIAAALKEAFGFFWVGFYVAKEGQLVLSAFQGPIACTRIEFDKGVCGRAYSTGEGIIVPDVDAFPGHIACSSLSRSEVVVPIAAPGGGVFGVLDVDSDRLDDFSEVDLKGLSAVAALVEDKLNRDGAAQ